MTVLTPGQVAVVTGAAAGIGLELTRAFVGRGLHVAMVDIDGALLAEAAAGVGRDGVRVETFVADVGSDAAVRAVAATCLDRFGAVDVVCLNAGVIGGLRHVWNIPAERWRRLAEVNIWGVVNGIGAFVPHLVARGTGHVLTTASMSGLSIVPGNADYAMTKHAAVAVSEALRAELDVVAPGVGVTIVCPGPVRTPMTNLGLAPPPDDPRLADPDGVRASIGVRSEAMVEPALVAELAVRAVEENRLYVTSSAVALERVHQRTDRLLDDLAAATISRQPPTERS